MLCAPVSAPVAEGRPRRSTSPATVGAPRNLAIHDRVYSEAGLGIVDGHFGMLLGEGQSYARLADGSDL